MRAPVTHKAKIGGRVGLKLLTFVALVASLLIVLPQAAFATTASDDFNRADGPLGANWTDISDGGLAISNQEVVGTSDGLSGDIRTGETYGSDQYSQIEITSTQLSGGQWVGPAVRARDSGHDAYVGLYFWDFGTPELMLFERFDDAWTQIGSTYNSGALAAGTQLALSATGSDLTLSLNGTAVITATDTSLTGGAPAIVAFSTATAGDWAGGDISSPPADAPEVPMVVLFPAAAVGLLGLSVLYRRRRTSRLGTTPFEKAG